MIINPIITIKILSEISGLANLTKFNFSYDVFKSCTSLPSLISCLFFFLIPNNQYCFLKKFEDTSNDNNPLDKNTAVTNIIKIPKSNIVAKPLTELSPKKKSTAAAMTVVKLESNIVKNELLFALEYACLSVRPILSSSLIRSYIMILASTAIPTPKTNAANPGRVNTPDMKLNATKVK
ncbi:Uncharacterised protein [Mycobacteroides abscessus subsp. massiliense]|nr:Uncharacterised protein [Mycobacteroides abscessus subsp. massiliense]